MRIEYAEVSLLGCRNDNQDRVSVAVSEHSALLVVIDGMGGHSDGAKAADEISAASISDDGRTVGGTVMVAGREDHIPVLWTCRP